MNRKLLLTLVAAIFLLSIALTGCQGGGIAQESYDELKALYDDIASKYQEAVSDAGDVQSEATDVSAELEAAQTEINELLGQVDELLGQVNDLTGQYVLVGATTAETAANIIRYYHETHVYDIYDMFVCSDMAAEVWNMLKAQGISATIVVGSIESPIMEITASNHSWVLAEVGPDELLALETTSGRVIPRDQNGLYYRGWTYDTPAEAKEHQRMMREYNTRVKIINDINDEINQVTTERNDEVGTYNVMIAGGYTSAEIEAQLVVIDQKAAIKQKLVEVMESMEDQLNALKAEIEGMATECGT